MGHMKILVYSNNSLWGKLCVSHDTVANQMLKMKRRDDFCDGDIDNGGFEIVNHQDLVIHSEGDQGDQVSTKPRTKFCLDLNSLVFSYFVKVLQCSRQFRIIVVDYWYDRIKCHIPSAKSLTLKITLLEPPHQVLDYNW